MLKKGEQGKAVKELQRELRFLGFYKGPLDGIYGPKTEKAVVDFQKEYGLTVDGIAGPETLDKTEEATTTPRPAQNRQLTKNFNEQEFACSCCGQVLIDMGLVEKLQEIRDKYGMVIINSGYRCPSHNKAVGGASNSQHLKGRAADIEVQGVSPYKVAEVAETLGFGGIGRYSSFTHVDTWVPGRRWSG